LLLKGGPNRLGYLNGMKRVGGGEQSRRGILLGGSSGVKDLNSGEGSEQKRESEERGPVRKGRGCASLLNQKHEEGEDLREKKQREGIIESMLPP